MRTVLFAFCLAIFFSCDRNKNNVTPDEEPEIVTPSPVLLPLAVGNYWIYQLSDDDSVGNLNLQNNFDSVFVEMDTMILSERYFKLRHTNTAVYSGYYSFQGSNPVQYLKDSSGYIVNIDHKIVLDKTHLNDTINRYILSPSEYGCVVPHTFSQKSFLIGTQSGNCMDVFYIRTAPSPIVDITASTYFVDNIGLVRSYYSYASCLSQCRHSHNLIRYHLN